MISSLHNIDRSKSAIGVNFDGTIGELLHIPPLHKNDYKLIKPMITKLIKLQNKYNLIVITNQLYYGNNLKRAVDRIKTAMNDIKEHYGLDLNYMICYNEDKFRKPNAGTIRYLRDHHINLIGYIGTSPVDIAFIHNNGLIHIR